MHIHTTSFSLFIGLTLFILYCGWRLIAKTGYPGYMVVLLFVPIINLIFILFMVFTAWPIESLLKRYESTYGEFPVITPDNDTSEPASCMKCGAVIPPQKVFCPKCGWSYKDPSPEEGAEQDAEPLSPTPAADIFRDQRGF